MIDPISDLLTRIRNAGLARHLSTRVPHSNLKVRIVELLKKEGYIENFEVDHESKTVGKDIVVYLRYLDAVRPAIHTMKRVSKPGRRFYCKSENLPKIRAGLGTAIISTSKGVITDREARKLKVGGEILCEIW